MPMSGYLGTYLKFNQNIFYLANQRFQSILYDNTINYYNISNRS